MATTLRSRIASLEAEVKHLRNEVDFYRRVVALAEEHIAYIDKAWSIIHPIDSLWMQRNPNRDWGNEILYSFRRALPSGVVFTGLSSWEYSGLAMSQLDKVCSDSPRA